MSNQAKKSSKAGRNAKHCERYRLACVREKNKARRIYTHFRRNLHDTKAICDLKRYWQYLTGQQRECVVKHQESPE